MIMIEAEATSPNDRDLLEDCFCVLLPVIGELDTPAWLRDLLEGGTAAVLLGETRDEYVARRMSAERRRTETAAGVRSYVSTLNAQAQRGLLVAVDQEPWGIQRLHDLVPAYPPPADLLRMPLPDIRDNARGVAEIAKAFGVSMFLSPVLDVVEGDNPWLQGRTLAEAQPYATIGDVAAAYVEGTQSGGVATVAKHFPGFTTVPLDPAQEMTAVRSGTWDERALQVFGRAVGAGTAGVMLGPAVVEDVDVAEPASTSRATVEMLRHTVGFRGLVVSDDLDAPATLHGRPLVTTMIASLRAGADLVLVAGGPHLRQCVEEIFDSARTDGDLSARIHSAATRVRAVGRTFAPRFA